MPKGKFVGNEGTIALQGVVRDGKLVGIIDHEEKERGIVLTDVNEVTGGSSLSGGLDGVMLDNFVEEPTGQPSVAAGAAGVLTGTYSYHVTFCTADGKETACWTGTPSTIAVTSKQIELTNIPVSPSEFVTARKLYRSAASPTDVKNTRYLTTINDNTTTTYTDNAADGTLGDPSPWISTGRGYITLGGSRVAVFGNGQAVSLGVGALANNSGYACTAVGFGSLGALTTGRRNVGVGTYALGDATTATESVAVGVHAGNLATTGGANTAVGYAAAMNNVTGLLNTAIGHQALQNCTGSSNVAIGAEAMQASTGANNNTAIGYGTLAIAAGYGSCVALGYQAGKYSAANNQFWIDNTDRGNLATAKTNSLMYGVFDAAPANQRLAINGLVKHQGYTVATLPAAAAGLTGYRGYVTDANATFTAGIGAVVAGGGANVVPVFCDGTNWRVG